MMNGHRAQSNSHSCPFSERVRMNIVEIVDRRKLTIRSELAFVRVIDSFDQEDWRRSRSL